jgi:hypothetical protein
MLPRTSPFGRAKLRVATNTWVTPHEVVWLIYTVVLKKVASDVAEGVTLRWLPVSFSHVLLFILISKWAPKFVKLEMYDL